MSSSWDALWDNAYALGRWAWTQEQSHLPREAWHRLRDRIPAAPIDPAARVEITRQSAGDTLWRKLWGGAVRQRLLRKMFELASAPALSVRDLAHLAFNAGQVRESGAIHNLERLAEENPDLAALRNIASVYDALRMGTLRAYIKPGALADVGAARLTERDIEAISASVSAKKAPFVSKIRPWESAALVIALCIVILVVIAYYARRLVAKNPRSIFVAVATSALVGGSAIYYTCRQGVKI